MQDLTHQLLCADHCICEQCHYLSLPSLFWHPLTFFCSLLWFSSFTFGAHLLTDFPILLQNSLHGHIWYHIFWALGNGFFVTLILISTLASEFPTLFLYTLVCLLAWWLQPDPKHWIPLTVSINEVFSYTLAFLSCRAQTGGKRKKRWWCWVQSFYYSSIRYDSLILPL